MKKTFYLGFFLFLALSTYRCDKSDDLTPNAGGDTTTTTTPTDTTTTTKPDKDTTTVTPTDTTTTKPDKDTTVIEPTDTATVDTTVTEPPLGLVIPDSARFTPTVPEDEAYYYTAPTSYDTIVNVVEDYGVDNDFDTDDSPQFKQAIKDVVAAGGGKIIVPAGNYSLELIELQSNIHFEIDGGAVIRPTLQKAQGVAYNIFGNKTGTATPHENISVVGVNGSFTFDLRYANNKKLRCMHFTHITNFMFANINVIDDNSTYAAIEFGGKTINKKVYGAHMGVVKNFVNTNSKYGYGLMQMQYGVDILFKDCHSVGGVTLRFESHRPTYFNTSCLNYITGIVGRNISCKNGHAAVMLSPHFVKNGWVDIRDVLGDACEATILIEGGYATDEEAAAGYEAGYFSEETTFRNVRAIFSATDAQIHPKHFVMMPQERQHMLPSTQPYIEKPGPSLNIISHGALYNANYDLRDITGEGFIGAQYVYIGTKNPKVNYPTDKDVY